MAPAPGIRLMVNQRRIGAEHDAVARVPCSQAQIHVAKTYRQGLVETAKDHVQNSSPISSTEAHKLQAMTA